MRHKFLYSAMILAALSILAACNATDNSVASNPKPASSPEPTYPDGVSRITPAQLEKLISQGQAYIVDVRTQDAFDLGHIPGSRLIPAGEVLNHASELPRDKTIVTYCS
jgi:3-mercaptopyruvate sulfurtransferase SseA